MLYLGSSHCTEVSVLKSNANILDGFTSTPHLRLQGFSNFEMSPTVRPQNGWNTLAKDWNQRTHHTRASGWPFEYNKKKARLDG